MNNTNANDANYCGFLFAAGETIEVDNIDHSEVMDDVLDLTDVKTTLKHICRMAIKNHLLKLDPHTHLFGRVPKLKLPDLLNHYLLFDQSLEGGKKDDKASAFNGNINMSNW